MKRAYLILVGILALGIAGCSGGEKPTVGDAPIAAEKGRSIDEVDPAKLAGREKAQMTPGARQPR
jgi:hypothetical protein